jgi:hypothetical protein
MTIKTTEVRENKKLKIKSHRKVKFESSNPKIAKVNKNGTITFKKAGRGKKVKLTAISKENPKLRKTIKVRIKKK